MLSTALLTEIFQRAQDYRSCFSLTCTNSQHETYRILKTLMEEMDYMTGPDQITAFLLKFIESLQAIAAAEVLG